MLHLDDADHSLRNKSFYLRPPRCVLFKNKFRNNCTTMNTSQEKRNINMHLYSKIFATIQYFEF
ncbi:MAG: hypothetical protein DWQ10_10335 [Calditrichaeota bacterium]|nr:MAG: hypothetical protein DWQ10_10335 [Calditrichota bacterium]